MRHTTDTIPRNGLGAALRHIRQSQGWTLRQVREQGGPNHVYLYRLEVGQQWQPGPAVVAMLIDGLCLPRLGREAEIVRWLADNPDADTGLVVHVLEQPTLTVAHLAKAHQLGFGQERVA